MYNLCHCIKNMHAFRRKLCFSQHNSKRNLSSSVHQPQPASAACCDKALSRQLKSSCLLLLGVLSLPHRKTTQTFLVSLFSLLINVPPLYVQHTVHLYQVDLMFKINVFIECRFMLLIFLHKSDF